MVHYFDNSATTPLSDAAKTAMAEAFDVFGNPSSVHSCGSAAARLLAGYRSDLIRSAGVTGMRPVFTSGGSEANNQALIGISYAKKRYRGGKIVISAAEHPSVLKTAAFLESEGFSVSRIAAPRGVFDFDAFERELTHDVFLVSVMLVNNEIGFINDINRIYETVKEKTDAVVHTDAVQGFRLIKGVKADLISVSGHKIGAPKGVGALFVGEGIIKNRGILPFIHGGEQETGLRAGTENIIGIAGFAGAAVYLSQNEEKTGKSIASISSYLKNELSGIPGIRLHTPEGRSTDSIINLSVGGIRAETLTGFLSSNGIMISAGSACSSKSKELSPALISFGLGESEARTAVRISIGAENTKEDADALIGALRTALETLRGSEWR